MRVVDGNRCYSSSCVRVTLRVVSGVFWKCFGKFRETYSLWNLSFTIQIVHMLIIICTISKIQPIINFLLDNLVTNNFRTLPKHCPSCWVTIINQVNIYCIYIVWGKILKPNYEHYSKIQRIMQKIISFLLYFNCQHQPNMWYWANCCLWIIKIGIWRISWPIRVVLFTRPLDWCFYKLRHRMLKENKFPYCFYRHRWD